MKQLIYTMFVSNSCASFYIKESQNIMKMIVASHDCRYNSLSHSPPHQNFGSYFFSFREMWGHSTSAILWFINFNIIHSHINSVWYHRLYIFVPWYSASGTFATLIINVNYRFSKGFLWLILNSNTLINLITVQKGNAISGCSTGNLTVKFVDFLGSLTILLEQ